MLKKFFTKQLASVIEWKNQQPDALWHKYLSTHDEIKKASKLILALGQGCILVYEGKVTDVLTEPGIYNLETDNHPFITTLINIRQQFESEHKLKIFFFRTAEVINQYWGTASPVKYIDNVYDIPVNVGLNGNFSYRIENPLLLFTAVIGSKDEFSSQEMKEIITGRILDQLRSLFAVKKLPYISIDAELPAMASEISAHIAAEFQRLGFAVTDFTITGSVFDEETIERIGRIADVSADVKAAQKAGLNYVDLEKIRALRDAAKNEGGLSGIGAQLGAGMEISKLFTLEKNQLLNGIDKTGEDVFEKLKKLKLLLDEQILTEEEFETIKQQLLNPLK